MKTKLITRLPERLFTFGCSFTNYDWPSWANIISYDLNVPLYNYGRCGAGNQFIFNTVMQADAKYQFTNNDLVIVSWTNVAREDKFKENSWVTPGNIYTQNAYSEEYVKKWACPIGYTIRDFAVIKATWELLDKKNCQFHFLKMIDFTIKNQWITNDIIHLVEKINELYNFYLEKILPSFYQVLWNNDIKSKLAAERQIYGKKFINGHPSIKEYLIYLENVFEHDFSTATQQQVISADQMLTNKILEMVDGELTREHLKFETVLLDQTMRVHHF